MPSKCSLNACIHRCSTHQPPDCTTHAHTQQLGSQRCHALGYSTMQGKWQILQHSTLHILPCPSPGLFKSLRPTVHANVLPQTHTTTHAHHSSTPLLLLQSTLPASPPCLAPQLTPANSRNHDSTAAAGPTKVVTDMQHGLETTARTKPKRQVDRKNLTFRQLLSASMLAQRASAGKYHSPRACEYRHCSIYSGSRPTDRPIAAVHRLLQQSHCGGRLQQQTNCSRRDQQGLQLPSLVRCSNRPNDLCVSLLCILLVLVHLHHTLTPSP